MDEQFYSPTYGILPINEVREKIMSFMASQKDCPYRIVIGSDSQPKSGGVDFVSALVVHRVGFGAIYFWQRIVKKRKYVLRDRIYEEAALSLLLADKFLAACQKDDGISRYDLEIHVDIGNGGETRNLINEVVGMIRGNGFTVKIKPDSYAASKVADRHT